MSEARITALEEKFAHQDYLLEQLNQIVTEQQFLIEKFKKDIEELKVTQTNSQNAGTRSLRDDIPPHY